MARYGDLDLLLENLKKQYGEELGWQCTVNMSDVGMMIEDAPTADVVEVVRCGQCKHWKINPNNLYGGYCRYCEGASIDHYCSYGERKK